MDTTFTAGQSVTFPFGVETLTGTVTRVSPLGYLLVTVSGDAPVMAGRSEVMVATETAA